MEQMFLVLVICVCFLVYLGMTQPFRAQSDYSLMLLTQLATFFTVLSPCTRRPEQHSLFCTDAVPWRRVALTICVLPCKARPSFVAHFVVWVPAGCVMSKVADLDYTDEIQEGGKMSSWGDFMACSSGVPRFDFRLRAATEHVIVTGNASHFALAVFRIVKAGIVFSRSSHAHKQLSCCRCYL